jgi:uncharacterized membrane protein YphA (DoxX/SURF4 family)
MRTVAGWILIILLALVFTLVGGMKLLGVPGAVREFEMIGFGQWFRYVTGVLEVTGAVGLLFPIYRFWSALLIAAIMACATMINIWILRVPGLARVTAVLMAMALVLAWLAFGSLRRPQKEKL